MTTPLDQFKSQLSKLLRDIPFGTTADLTAFAVAYWDGQQVIYAFTNNNGSVQLEDQFDLGEYEWARWYDEFSAWIAHPVFSVRPEVAEIARDCAAACRAAMRARAG
ncbi:hypothetical protein [Paraburkholderia sp. RL17-337-BIB-A]|uniref:hypothetical protein n=1 Tax=Paraburkholderia sp. RL17-337-BIB-A TaxID=3031636 RepID=UPI0038BB4B54